MAFRGRFFSRSAIPLLTVSLVLVSWAGDANASEHATEEPLWSLQPRRDTPLPTVQDQNWPANEIDHFVLHDLESHGLTPSPPADRNTLLRRATFDLTGLPPTPEEVASFTSDRSPDAFAKVVDRLLSSPAYGERYGRHWLDVVRYADTAGDGADYPVREAYKYRDWVINAFNTDLPYNDFVRRQVAGDLLSDWQPDAVYRDGVIATGYLAVGKRFGYNANSDAFRHLDIADTIEVLGQSILGLSIACARCHDHKYDPITREDYYALYGIFAGTRFAFPGGEETQHPVNLVPLVRPTEAKRLDQERAALLAELDAQIHGASATSNRPASAASGKADVAAGTGAQNLVAVESLRGLKALQDKRAAMSLEPPYEVAYGVVDAGSVDVPIQIRGDPNVPGSVVHRRFLSCLGGAAVPASARGSGRAELADWLVRDDNPLTARVIVNRVWQWHFGQGLVRTPNDFGTRGERPDHPELLDWLAERLIADGWSLKKLHRLVMLSRAYQMGGAGAAEGRERDPENRLIWRFAPKRLDAEEIRDTMLMIAGRLDRSPGGPHPFPPVQTWRFTIHNPFYANYDSDRRSVYLMVQRQKRNPFLELFDAPDPNLSTGERADSITPRQALYLMNDPFVHRCSAAAAARLMSDQSLEDDAARLAFVWLQAVGREPTAEEREAAKQFLNAYQTELAPGPAAADDPASAAWAAYVRVLLTSNETLYVD